MDADLQGVPQTLKVQAQVDYTSIGVVGVQITDNNIPPELVVDNAMVRNVHLAETGSDVPS